MAVRPLAAREGFILRPDGDLGVYIFLRYDFPLKSKTRRCEYKMKVLLKEDVAKLGKAGDVVTVADGFARNYLIPNQLAVKASPGQIKQVDVIRRQAQLKRDRIAEQMAVLAEKLTSVQLTFAANASEKGRLYGSITRDDIADALEAAIGEPIDRRKIEVDPLRQIGLHSIPVRLGAGLTPEVVAIVHREGEDPAAYLTVAEEPAPEADDAESAGEASDEPAEELADEE